MFTRVTLTATEGPLKGEEFSFRDHTVCTVGRAPDCLLRLPGSADLMASRRHCVLAIDPPTVRIRDLGSRNGTFVNGVKIGQRYEDPFGPPYFATPHEWVLHDGDCIRVGESIFVLTIREAASVEEGQEEGLAEPRRTADSGNLVCC
jgi:pSer/pThr/pTyr-binding forkhead associated (FHA) protein